MTILEQPRILFVDAYDSFSNNIISLLETELNAEVTIVKIDDAIENLGIYLKEFVAVVAGPGPGDPRTPEDVGLFRQLWELDGADTIPVLGVCLGFQSLVLAHGGQIKVLPEPRHGILRNVMSNGESIFRGIPTLKTVQYHSLHATIDNPIFIRREEGLEERSVTARACPDLVPLAWDHEAYNSAAQQEPMNKRNPHSILMAVKHKRKPLYGIQFHPESVSSDSEARRVMKNWWDEIRSWRAKALNHLSVGINGFDGHHLDGQEDSCNFHAEMKACHTKLPSNPVQKTSVMTHIISLADLTIPSICEIVGASQGDSIVFESQSHQSTETSKFSIIGIIEEKSLRFEYRVGRAELLQICDGKASNISLKNYDNNLFVFLESFMESRKVTDGNRGIPFWGGLMGYISYETCLEVLGVHDLAELRTHQNQPDLGFVFIERSIVIDHVHKAVHIQSIKSTDHSWASTTSSLLSASTNVVDCSWSKLNSTITFPDEEEYKSRIRACQVAIRAGDSYELCLTNQANITTSAKVPSWPLYCRLRSVNPAPFGAYIRSGDLTVLSSSPERFMRWTRPIEATGKCTRSLMSPSAATSVLQFRPIKGTLARRSTSDSAPWSLDDAKKLLSTQKEQAENLMIVDLIRHDLHGVVGSGRVEVPKLMVVEEYETVFQLVSVVEGKMVVERPLDKSEEKAEDLKSANGDMSDLTNGFYDPCLPHVDVHNLQRHQRAGDDLSIRSSRSISRPKPSTPLLALPNTLPPGSMTGAPKLRSCQILRSLERTPRGIYSGVIGYIDVGGGGDWSVAIRCAVRWDNPENVAQDHWTVGAGGAVTALSTEQGEWEEMLAKLQATLRIFQD